MCNTCNIARQAYRKAEGPLEEIYLKAVRPLWGLHLTHENGSFVAYNKARKPFLEVYEKAAKPLWEAYCKVKKNCKDHV